MTEPDALAPASEILARILDTAQPGSLICCGTTAQTVARHWRDHHTGSHLTELDPADPNADLPPAQVMDLALVSDTLEHLPHAEAALLLGQLRNYGTRQIAVLVGPVPDWAFTDFIGLGFRRHATIQQNDTELTLYTYNLDTYNHKRAWNNPDNWANPEMWGKAWW